MAHKRSLESRQRRDARRFIIKNSFRDYCVDETVNRVTWTQVENHLIEVYNELLIQDLDVGYHDFVKGEVIMSSRGDGSFQLSTTREVQG